MKRPFRPYEGTEPYIFVSYARKDQEIVFSTLEAMDQCGYRIWYDAGVYAGDQWSNVIAEHVHQCTVGMVFLSSSFVHSMHCKAEAMELLAYEKAILPVRLDAEIDLPAGLSMSLRQFQSIGLYEDEPLDGFLAGLACSEALAPCRAQEGAG